MTSVLIGSGRDTSDVGAQRKDHVRTWLEGYNWKPNRVSDLSGNQPY